MGKKAKIGKQRKDKYYQLAKETGYRSRAAFKLIQLNRKFSFLQNSRVCLDLCAAPGGWMQVAQQNMPLSSIVIGVDLFPIKAVPGCISLVEDITTEKCKTSISKEIKTWKADVVLNDGAPNVGTNWIHDAYSQCCLTLSALKLATHFLRKGGWFVTKIFRSRDYNALLWVFKQLFKKVHATKPQASRSESAEIFVVCQHYIAPDKIDPKFLDPKHVFEDIEAQPKNKLSQLLKPVKKPKKPKALGYKDDDYTLYHTINVVDFINKENVAEPLQYFNAITFGDDEFSTHPQTTTEIKECCKDLKVLNRKDLKALVNWWKNMRELNRQSKDETGSVADGETGEAGEKIFTLEEMEDQEDEAIAKQITELEEEEAKELKRKIKRVKKERQKLNEKLNLKMVLKGDAGPSEEADDLFQLQHVKSHQILNTISDQSPDVVAESESETDEDIKIKKKYEKYDVSSTQLDSSGLYYKDSESELEMETDSEDDDDKEGLGFSDMEDENTDIPKKNSISLKNGKNVGVKENPLLFDLDNRDLKTKREHKADLWFQKDAFKNLEEDDDEDLELDRMAEIHKKKGGKIIGEDEELSKKDKKILNNKKNFVSLHNATEDSADEDDSDESENDNKNMDIDDETTSDSDSDYDLERPSKKDRHAAGKVGINNKQINPAKQDEELKRLKKNLKMDEEGLALGTLLATSRKRKRDIIDAAWNRYTFNDKNLPDWFADDEKKHMKKDVPVPQELVEEYKKSLQEINVRPIKKVMEAKARKKKRVMRRMEKAKKKVETIMENADVGDREKARQIKQLYRKIQQSGKKEVTYIVAKKHNSAKRMKRPKGVKGPYRVVDPRMKKDLRAMKAKEKTIGRRKGGGKGKFQKGRKGQKTK